MALKFHTGVVKKLNRNVRKLWDLVPTFVGVTVEKLVVGGGGGGFWPRGRRGKLLVLKTFCHLVNISSLFPLT